MSKTNPSRKDTDRDRLKDRYELRVSKTKPRRKDTDRDGLSDGDEVLRWKTNPRRKDSDGDGIPDGVAVLLESMMAPVTAVVGPVQAARRRGDRTPPTVSFRTPEAGQTVAGQLDEPSGNCDATASDSRGVDRVEFYLDGQPVNTESTPAYSCIIDTTSHAEGLHSIMAKAYDTAGNSATSTISVVFDNASDASPPPDTDTTAPDTSISSGPSGSTTSTSASFSFASTESGSTFECKLDSGSLRLVLQPEELLRPRRRLAQLRRASQGRSREHRREPRKPLLDDHGAVHATPVGDDEP